MFTNLKTNDTMKLEDLPTATRKGLDVEIDRQEFALTLKTYRLRHNLTQAQLGQRFGCSRFLILKAETAKPISWESAYKLFNRLSHELSKEQLSHEVHYDH